MRKIILIAIFIIIVLGLISGLSWTEITAWAFDLIKVFFKSIGNFLNSVVMYLQNYIASLNVGL